jgi:hypothetical protein
MPLFFNACNPVGVFYRGVIILFWPLRLKSGKRVFCLSFSPFQYGGLQILALDVFELMNDTFQNFPSNVYPDDESVNIMCGLLQTGY